MVKKKNWFVVFWQSIAKWFASNKGFNYILYGTILILLGIVVLLVIALKSPDTCKAAEVFSNIAMSLIVAGSVSILLELNDFKQYFSNRMVDILIHNDYIDKLDLTELKKLNKQVEERLYLHRIANPNTTFFSAYKNQIERYIDKCFYSRSKCTVNCTINETEKTITKYILNHSTIENPLKKPTEFTHKFKWMSASVDDINPTVPPGQKPIIIVVDNEYRYTSSFKVEDNSIQPHEPIFEEFDLEKNIWQTLKSPPPPDFPIVFDQATAERTRDDENSKGTKHLMYSNIHAIGFKITLSKKCVVTCQYASVVPLEDRLFIWTFYLPCRHFSMLFAIDNEEKYGVAADIIGTMAVPNASMVYPPNRTGIVEIDCPCWMMPDEGILVAIVDKTSTDNDPECGGNLIQNIQVEPKES